jgi:hypothetical protein
MSSKLSSLRIRESLVVCSAFKKEKVAFFPAPALSVTGFPFYYLDSPIFLGYSGAEFDKFLRTRAIAASSGYFASGNLRHFFLPTSKRAQESSQKSVVISSSNSQFYTFRTRTKWFIIPIKNNWKSPISFKL